MNWLKLPNRRCFIILSLITVLSLQAQDRITGEPFARRTVVLGQNGMVATSQPLATQIGSDILKDGGNAIDAAIAAKAALGVMGGDFQPMGHTQNITTIVDFGMNIQEAADAPRWDHTGGASPTGQTTTDSVTIGTESGISYETIRALMDRGHSVGTARVVYGGYQAIMWDDENKVYHGASEKRKDGQAEGF